MLNSLEERIIKGLRRIAIWRKIGTGRDPLAFPGRRASDSYQEMTVFMKIAGTGSIKWYGEPLDFNSGMR
jgi:hypothetical protein